MQNPPSDIRWPCAVWVHSREGDLERTHTAHAGGCRRAGSAFCDYPLRLTIPRRQAAQRTIATLRAKATLGNATDLPSGLPLVLSLSLRETGLTCAAMDVASRGRAVRPHSPYRYVNREIIARRIRSAHFSDPEKKTLRGILCVFRLLANYTQLDVSFRLHQFY